jgi:outer membrane protein
MKRLLTLLLASLLALLALAAVQGAAAADLVEAWRAAVDNDREYAAARAERDAGATKREQGASLWRPSVDFSGTVGVANGDTSINGARFSAPGFGTVDGADFDTSINGGTAARWALRARQPLYSPARDADRRQLELSADVSDLQWQAAQQALMLRTAERYFDVALAAESLRVLERQQRSVQRALVEARDRFQLGDAPVTDSHEAEARAQAVRAEVLAAESELTLKQAALSDLTGWSAAQLSSPALAGGAMPQDLPPLATWLADAKVGNLQLRMSSANVEVARQEAAKFKSEVAPTVDLVASFAQDRLRGSGNYGSATNSQSNALIGVQLNVPLYSGGLRGARREESLHLADKARAEGERAAQQVALQTRAAWLGLTVGASRVTALDEALRATRSRLDATRIGRQVGERTTLELLNAENDAAATELALLRARVSLLLDRLRLAALAGRLDEDHLRQVNASLLRPKVPR